MEKKNVSVLWGYFLDLGFFLLFSVESIIFFFGSHPTFFTSNSALFSLRITVGSHPENPGQCFLSQNTL